jgi:RNA polymerase sigma-70 factor (ECF subfamily)
MPWLYAVARSRLVDAIRRERRFSVREVHDDRLIEKASEQAVDPPGVHSGDLRAAMAALPATHRRVLELLKLEDRTVNEVAMKLDLSPGNVRVIAHRALKALRRLLEGQ